MANQSHPVGTVTTTSDPEFQTNVTRIMNRLSHGEDVSNFKPLDIAAAMLLLKYEGVEVKKPE